MKLFPFPNYSLVHQLLFTEPLSPGSPKRRSPLTPPTHQFYLLHGLLSLPHPVPSLQGHCSGRPQQHRRHIYFNHSLIHLMAPGFSGLPSRVLTVPSNFGPTVRRLHSQLLRLYVQTQIRTSTPQAEPPPHPCPGASWPTGSLADHHAQRLASLTIPTALWTSSTSGIYCIIPGILKIILSLPPTLFSHSL